MENIFKLFLTHNFFFFFSDKDKIDKHSDKFKDSNKESKERSERKSGSKTIDSNSKSSNSKTISLVGLNDLKKENR